MLQLLWMDAVSLAVGAIVAILDFDFRVGAQRVGRPVYGGLVLLGLVGLYAEVVETGYLPPPGWPILAFAVLYLPFLSTRFIDLELTDAVARDQLEELLLTRDFGELRHASDQGVVRYGRRRLRFHWECSLDDDGLFLELDVHPSLMPVTISRPHVVHVRDPLHLEKIRADIRRRRSEPATRM